MKRENDPAMDKTFATGAKREALDPLKKPALELISPIFLEEVCLINKEAADALRTTWYAATNENFLYALHKASLCRPDDRVARWAGLAIAWDTLRYDSDLRVGLSPKCLRALGTWCGLGAQKYAPWNWAKGIPLSRNLGSCLRHVLLTIEKDTSEDHDAAVTWNLMALVHTQKVAMSSVDNVIQGLDDLPVFM